MKLPSSIASLVENRPFTEDSIGLSGSQVLLYDEMVLKIQPNSPWIKREAEMLRWLEGKLPAPRLLEFAEEAETSFLLMSRCHGEMACAPRYMSAPELQLKLLAEGLQRLWQVPINGCPSDRSLTVVLKEAEERVENNLVEMELAQPDTFGPGGFSDPEALLIWLYRNRPEEELTFCHCDYCLPNVFFQGEQFGSFIDLGQSGIADRWYDIAICYRSLIDNHRGRYSNGSPSSLQEDLLFDFLGLAPDQEKIRYYILLDELF